MSFAQPIQFQRRAGLPLAPMIDILFLLLIFFATTSSFQAEERDVPVDLPAAESSESPSTVATQIIVNVKADGTLLIGNEAYNLDALRELLTKVIADYPDERVVIRGDKTADWGDVLAVMDTARAVGVKNVSAATVKKASEIGE